MQKQTQAQEPDVLRRVTIRLVREAERGEFDFRLEHQHYLGSAVPVDVFKPCAELVQDMRHV